jgi:hypothetical protein
VVPLSDPPLGHEYPNVRSVTAAHQLLESCTQKETPQPTVAKTPYSERTDTSLVFALNVSNGYEEADVLLLAVPPVRLHVPLVADQRGSNAPVPENSSVNARAAETAESTIPGIID